jgi:CII-binding regulator of phage lambda lysogenization HflD
MTSIYQQEFKVKKDGTKSKVLKIKVNRSGNATTIGLPETILRLSRKGVSLNKNLIASIRSLIELRDNAIHFHNTDDISKEIQELGFATIKNYMSIIKQWDLRIDLTQYNFYLMPLAYVDSKIESDSILTDEVKNYLNYLKGKVAQADETDKEFDVAIGIDISFKKANAIESIGMKFDKGGIAVNLSEEDVRQKYPYVYKDVTTKAKIRYSNFKQGPNFNAVMKGIKAGKKLCHVRLLDQKNPKSSQKYFYSSNVWKVLDQHYKKLI